MAVRASLHSMRSLLTSIAPAAKRIFAKSAAGFAKRAADWPAWPTLELASGLAIMLATLTGPFGTDAIDPARRAAFWGLLIGFNLIGWRMLINRMLHSTRDWPRVAVLGTVLLNLPLPLEIPLVLRIVGVVGTTTGAWMTWLEAAGLTLLIYAATRLWARPKPAAVVDPSALDALQSRWAVAPGALAAVLAEDHYCRLVLNDGSERLVHGRFGDAVAALAAMPGTQVHRGAWVADAAVRGAVRDGRGWRLRLAGGRTIKVSARHRGAARRRGLLSRA